MRHPAIPVVPGPITEGWPETRLDALCERVNDPIDSTELNNSDWLYYSIPALEETGNPQIQSGEGIDSNKLAVKSGDVLISKLNPRKSRIATVTQIGGLQAIASTEFVVLRPHNVQGRFLSWFLQSEPVRCLLAGRVESVTRSHQRVNPDDVAKLRVRLPTAAEQTRIANFLDEQTARIDALIAEKERLDALLSESLESAVENAVLPKVRGRMTPLKRVALRIITGPFGSALHSSEYSEGGVPVINPSHIINGLLCPNTDVSVSQKKVADMSAYKIRAGDVIVGRRGEMGRCAVVPDVGDGWLCGTGCLLVSPYSEKVLPEYLQLVISSRAAREWLSLESVGSTMENLSAEIIGRLPGYFPPLQEQGERLLDAKHAMAQHGALMRHVAEHIALLREYRSSLISAAVTGQLDIGNFGRQVA